MKRPALVFAAVALLYTFAGLLPGRLLVPLDIPRDAGAWKHDPAVRVRVANSLLSDVALQFVPWDVEVRRLAAAGEMPWRNVHAADGAPLFANPQTALLSPFTWPRLLFGLRGWAISVLLKMLVAALAMYWLARTLRVDEGPAMASGLVYALSGFATVWALHPHTNVLPLLPALAAAAIRLARETTAPRVMTLALLAAAATAGGHPETLFVGAVAIAVFILANRDEAPRLTPIVAASLSGFLLLGAQLVPFAMLLARSHARLARAGDLPIRVRKLSVISELLPGYLGSPLRGELDLTGAFSFAESFHQRNGAYVGALVLLAIALTWRSLAAPLRRGVVIGVCGFVLSLSLPGLAHALRAMPIVKWVAFEYWAVPFVLFASLAAGPALFAVTTTDRRKVATVLAIVALLLIAAGVLPALAPSLLQRLARAGIAHLQASGFLHQPPAVYQQRLAGYLAAAEWTAIRRIALPGACALLFAVALFRRRAELAVVGAIAELVAFGYGYAPAIRTDEIAPPPSFVAQTGSGVIASSNEVFPPNLATLYGLHDIRSYDVLTSEAATQRLVAAGFDPLANTLPVAPSDVQLRALAAQGVRYFIGYGGVIELPNPAPAPVAHNTPPDGLQAGLWVTAAGAALLALLLFGARR